MYKKGDICYGKIINISTQKLVVKSNRNFVFIIPKKMVTDWSKNNLLTEFKIGEKINFIIEEWNSEKKEGLGNFKALHPLFARKPFVAHLAETKHGFETLKASLDD
ncbi:hypothetical protein [Mycoplasmopsis iners]|uniref:hypothetical protein n=1 Tax=Mycoplasmopsis iners TaxID=76630 RepID=UPI00068EDEA6|nr:hypothetical protein [Mycoplasmopsis iners]